MSQPPRYRFFAGKGGVGKTNCAASTAIGAAETGRRVLLVSTDPAHSLGDALRSPLLVLFGGKGGVGKTTCAATFALDLAARGARVLLLSIDPAHSLADVLGVPLSDEARPLPGAPRGLVARELDAVAAFRAQRERYLRGLDELFEALRGGAAVEWRFDRAVLEDLIHLAPPGIDELFALFAVIDALESRADLREAAAHASDVVVVDTAPTGHALRLLELPKALSWVHALLAILLKYGRALGLGDLAASLTRTARELRELQALLRDASRTRFVAVSRAAELPRVETARLFRKLGRLGIARAALLVNALTPPGCPRCERARRAERRELAPWVRARRSWAMLGAPAVAPPPRGLAALRAFGRTWTRIAG